MRLGLSMLLFAGRVTAAHHPLFARFKAAGYDGVEVPVTDGEDADYPALARVLDAAGLQRTAVGFSRADADPIHPDAAVRRRAVDHLRRLVDRARALGCTLLGGPIHAAYATFPAVGGPDEDRLARSADVLRAAAEYAAQAGVRLGIEHLNRFECFLCTTAAETRALLRRIDHPACGAVYDSHHAHIEERAPATAIGALDGVLTHVQLSESHRGVLGTGQVRWRETFAALRAAGYDGWLVVEAFSRQDPQFGAALRIWRDLFAEPREVWEPAVSFVRAGWDAAGGG